MKKALVIYHSQQFGNTKLLAEAFADGGREAGADVELINTNEHGKVRHPLDSFTQRFFKKVGKTAEFARPINEEAKKTCHELGKQLVVSLVENT